MIPRRKPVAKYRVGESFDCAKRPTLDIQGTRFGEPCGATIVMHKYWWCHQICPACLTCYYVSYTADGGDQVFLDGAALGWPPDGERKVRANIAANGGQYIPTF